MNDLKEDFIEIRTKIDIIKKRVYQNKKKLAKAEARQKDLQDTLDLLNKVVEIVHGEFQAKINKSITASIKKIFNRDITFEIRHEEKSNAIHTRLNLMENGFDYDPKEDEIGGSVLDLIIFMLRIILILMSDPKKRPILVLDEPFKMMGDLALSMGIIIREIISAFNTEVQIIMTTHNKDLIPLMDRVYEVSHNGIKSTVKRRRDV